jgi:hypothetical protein
MPTYNDDQGARQQTPQIIPQRTITMTKLCKALCSLFFATTIAFPGTVLASTNQETDDTADELVAGSGEEGTYNLAFLNGDFGLHKSRAAVHEQCGTMLVFLCGPQGKIVKDAQVVTTIVDQHGNQTMHRARPLKGGYLVDTEHLAPGPYRLETEIITAGRMLTDELHFHKA